MVILKRYLQYPATPITVNVIGAGGTGSMILTHLARINSTLHAIDERMLMVKVYDPDKVTEANMGRQMFSMADLGRNKAEVLIDRINRFYGLNWDAVPHEANGSATRCNVLITCTDTKASRRSLFHHYKNDKGCDLQSEHNYFWIDCGNDQHSGNVIVGSKEYQWPTVVEHPSWTDVEDKQTPSCSIAEAIGKQDLFINSWIASVAGTWLWQFLHKKQINWRGAFLNIDTMNLRKIPVNEQSQVQSHQDGQRTLSNKRTAKAGKKAGQTEARRVQRSH